MSFKIKINKEDRAWSEIVRSKGRCQNCGSKTKVLNAHHIMPRGRHATRYVLENSLCLCVSCHVFDDNSVHKSPEGSKKFCVRIIGLKEYKRLEKLSNKTMSDREAKKIFWEMVKVI